MLENEMKIIIAIPTCSPERIPGLIKAVESIQGGSYKNVHPVILVDGNLGMCEVLNKQLHNVSIISNRERMDWVFSVNRIFKEFDSEYYIYASDDLFFPPGCIEYAMIKMRQRFPDGFGVISIGKKHKCAFGLLGRKFIEHFPDRQVFCPDYVHYGSDSELWRTVNKLGKFDYLRHRPSSVAHPRIVYDETKEMAEENRTKDQAIYRKREEMGLNWGIDFKLIAEK